MCQGCPDTGPALTIAKAKAEATAEAEARARGPRTTADRRNFSRRARTVDAKRVPRSGASLPHGGRDRMAASETSPRFRRLSRASRSRRPAGRRPAAWTWSKPREAETVTKAKVEAVADAEGTDSDPKHCTSSRLSRAVVGARGAGWHAVPVAAHHDARGGIRLAHDGSAENAALRFALGVGRTIFAQS